MTVEDGRFIPGSVVRMTMLGVALVLGWMSVRVAVQDSVHDADPHLAAQFWPADGVSLAALARQRVAAASGDIDDTTRALYRSALTRDPLLADPLALAGLDAAAKGDIGRAARLMVAARDRDPRAPLARFWLLDHYVRTGHYAAALDEVGPAIHLRPEAITAIMTVLAAIAATPEGQRALADKLATRPFWRTAFFNTAANTTSPDTLLALLSPSSSAAKRAATEDEQRAVFIAMINAGDGGRAYRAWQQLLPTHYRERAHGIYDGNFGRWPGARPFNWILPQDEIGSTRMVTAGDLPQTTALDVRYFGSTAGVLAEQYVYAQSGTYQLRLAARRRATGATGGRLSMEVRCANGAVLATLPLDPLDTQLRTLSTPVNVAPGCEMLRVRLVGTPGEMFSEIEAQVTGVELVPSG
jgi:hypothetical protein